MTAAARWLMQNARHSVESGFLGTAWNYFTGKSGFGTVNIHSYESVLGTWNVAQMSSRDRSVTSPLRSQSQSSSSVLLLYTGQLSLRLRVVVCE